MLGYKHVLDASPPATYHTVFSEKWPRCIISQKSITIGGSRVAAEARGSMNHCAESHGGPGLDGGRVEERANIAISKTVASA